MDIIMPPLKISKYVTDISHPRNNNYCLSASANASLNEGTLYMCESYPLKVLNNLNTLRQSGCRFCDVEIITENKIFKVGIFYYESCIL